MSRLKNIITDALQLLRTVGRDKMTNDIADLACTALGSLASDYDTRIECALEDAFKYGSIDGAHHKDWVIDQMVRKLCGTEEAYEDWVAQYGGEKDEDGCPKYEWDTGIAP